MRLLIGPGRLVRELEVSLHKARFFEQVRLQKESPIMDTLGNKELDPKSLAGKQNPIHLQE